MGFSIWQGLIILAVVLLLFGGRGKISAIMGDVGKGLRSFRTGLKGKDDAALGEVDDDSDFSDAGSADAGGADAGAGSGRVRPKSAGASRGAGKSKKTASRKAAGKKKAAR